MARRKKAPTRISAQAVKPGHHLQARVSEEVRIAVERFATEHQISPSEVVRDAVVAYIFGTKPGQTMAGPDAGYRLAKSAAGVIARQMLYQAYQSMPDAFEEWLEQARAEGVPIE